MRLLLTGDLHIGRSSTGVSTHVARDELRAAAAWLRIVDLAVAEQVDLVCLSGDVVDKENKFWEAVGPLERGVRRLAAAGIRTLAVGGNHDFDVLGRLADQLPPGDFRVLGRRGRWERFTLEKDGRPLLHVDGWSFPQEHVRESPLLSYDLDADASAPILGLVHGDLDVRGSAYAPLESDRLVSLTPQAWVLGHIHRPDLRNSSTASWILYPGSPQALDFGETGRHGVWMLEIDSRIRTPEQWPLSTVQYEYLQIDVGGTERQDEVESLVVRSIREAARGHVEQGAPSLRCLSLRLNITGRTPLAPQIGEITDRLAEDFELTIGDTTVVIDQMRITTLPDIDLHEYAGSQSAPGAVARLLLALDESEPPGEVVDLIDRTRRELANVDNHKHFAGLAQRDISDDIARAYLRDRANALFTQLVQQAA